MQVHDHLAGPVDRHQSRSARLTLTLAVPAPQHGQAPDEPLYQHVEDEGGEVGGGQGGQVGGGRQGPHVAAEEDAERQRVAHHPHEQHERREPGVEQAPAHENHGPLSGCVEVRQ